MKKFIFILLTSMAMSPFAASDTITCPGLEDEKDRQIVVGDIAAACNFGYGNSSADKIANEFGDLGWTEVDQNTEDDSGSGILSTTITNGGWGTSPVDGTFTISTAFWDNYEMGVLSFHVGNGGGDPDHISFLLDGGGVEGFFEYDLLSGSGGGLSNLKLYGGGAVSSVPAPSILILMLVGFITLIITRKRG